MFKNREKKGSDGKKMKSVRQTTQQKMILDRKIGWEYEKLEVRQREKERKGEC